MCTNDEPEPVHEGGWENFTTVQSKLKNMGYEFHYLSATTKAADLGAANTLIIIMGLENPLTSAEIVALGEFLDDGGHVILCADDSSGSRLGSIYGIEYEGAPVLASDFDENLDKNASFLHTDAALGGKFYSVFFNGATGMRVNNEDAVYYAEAAPLSVFDYNRNKVHELGEYPEFDIPLVVKVPAKNGDIIFISNSGLFSNDMLHRMDNEAFLKAIIVDSIGTSGRVYYDDSHQMSSFSGHVLYPE